MRKEVLLLEYLIGLWDDVEHHFAFGHTCSRLSLMMCTFLWAYRGEGLLSSCSGHRETPQPTEAYVVEHCIPGSRLVGGRIVIKYVRDLALRSILFAITKLAGSISAHLASKSQMSYALQCVEPRLFNWSAGFLQNVKEHISKCMTGRQKQFGYGSFLVLFFLE
jgi:hypothetical protein